MAKPWDYRKGHRIRFRISKGNLKRLLEKYFTYQAVGDIIGVSRERVRQYINAYGLKQDPEARKAKKFLKQNKEALGKFADLFIKHSMSIPACSTEMHTADRTIQKMLSQYSAGDLAWAMKKSQQDLINKNLASIRMLCGVTQAELGRRLKINQSVVSDRETQMKRLTASAIVRQAKALGIPVEMFLRPIDINTIRACRAISGEPKGLRRKL